MNKIRSFAENDTVQEISSAIAGIAIAFVIGFLCAM